MAVAIALSDMRQSVDAQGRRRVAVTLDFDTGNYVTNGIPLATSVCTFKDVTNASTPATATNGLMGAIGLKQIDMAHVTASLSVDAPYTRAQWVTANTTATYNYFVDIATNGTKQAPLLLIYSAGAELSGAMAAAAQVRIRFEGH